MSKGSLLIKVKRCQKIVKQSNLGKAREDLIYHFLFADKPSMYSYTQLILNSKVSQLSTLCPKRWTLDQKAEAIQQK